MISSDVKNKLTCKNDKDAYSFMQEIVTDSNISNKWYKYFDEYISLLKHPNSLVRNRGIAIISANAKWDVDNKFDSIIDDYLLLVNDEKPITCRQCIKSLIIIGEYKKNLIPKIIDSLKNIDLSIYKDSMRPLIIKDIDNTIGKLDDM